MSERETPTAARRRVRVILRGVIARLLPGPIQPRKRLVVVGTPRSGTSWLAKALSLAPGVSYYFEPDRLLAAGYRYRYLDPAVRDRMLERHIRRMFRGRFCGDEQIAEKGMRDLLATPFSRTVLLKWVWLGLSLEWITERFPDVVIVQIVRHPVPQFLSWAARGWSPERALLSLTAQEPLMAGPLRRQRALMDKASGFWQCAGAFWGATTTMQLRAHRKGWVLREHEWYCLEPTANVRRLTGELGLEWSGEIEGFLSPARREGYGPGYGSARDSRAEVTKWIGKVSAAELAELRCTLEPFELPFYPDLDPVPALVAVTPGRSSTVKSSE